MENFHSESCKNLGAGILVKAGQEGFKTLNRYSNKKIRPGFKKPHKNISDYYVRKPRTCSTLFQPCFLTTTL